MWPVANLKAFLSGSWQLERTLVDLRHSISGKLDGLADFTPSGRSLLYKEHGTLTFGAHRGPAEQHLNFEFPSDDARALVTFRDGRVFHELDLSKGEAVVFHACDPDLYEGRFVAMGASQWQSTWKVTGPRKDQEIVTLYTRLG